MACYSCNAITKVILRYSRTQQTHLTRADDCILRAFNLSSCLLSFFFVFFEDFNMSSCRTLLCIQGTQMVCVCLSEHTL